MKATIAISRDTKVLLDKLKVHPRETYEDVVKRLIEQISKERK